MKKIVSIILAVLLTGAVLAGCGPKVPNINFDEILDEASQASENIDDIKPPVDTDNRPVDTSSPVGDSYSAYIDAKSNIISRLSEALSENEDTLFATMDLLGITMIDLVLVPAALFGQDEQGVKMGLAFMGAEDVQYSQDGSSYSISYKDSDGKTAVFSGSYDATADSLITKVTENGTEIVYSEYRKTSSGYVGLYYSHDDGGTLYKLVINGEDGAVGIMKNTAKPAALTGGETADFVSDCDQWYAISGTTVTGLTSDGKTVNFEYTP